MTDFRGEEITWAATTRANRVVHIDHIYPYSRLTSKLISDIAEDGYEELCDDVGNKAFAIGESNTSKNKKFPGEEALAEGQWMDGFKLLSEKDYNKMKGSQNIARQNWKQIRSFIEDRHQKIVKDIRNEIK